MSFNYSCPNCSSTRHISLFSKACNYNYYSIPHLELENDNGSYLPSFGIGFDDGDGFNGRICLDCGRVQGKFPISDDALKAAVARSLD